MTGDTYVSSINVCTCSSQTRKQRESLIETTGDVQKYILVNASIVGIKISIIPLKRTLCCYFLIGPAVIDLRSNYVNTVILNGICNIKPKGHYAVFTSSNPFPIK